MSQGFADLFFRNADLVGHRRPSVACPVERQPLDVEFCGYRPQGFLDAFVESVVRRCLLCEAQDMFPTEVSGNDFRRLRLHEQRHGVGFFARGLRAYEVCPAIAQPVGCGLM